MINDHKEKTIIQKTEETGCTTEGADRRKELGESDCVVAAYKPKCLEFLHLSDTLLCELLCFSFWSADQMNPPPLCWSKQNMASCEQFATQKRLLHQNRVVWKKLLFRQICLSTHFGNLRKHEVNILIIWCLFPICRAQASVPREERDHLRIGKTNLSTLDLKYSSSLLDSSSIFLTLSFPSYVRNDLHNELGSEEQFLFRSLADHTDIQRFCL